MTNRIRRRPDEAMDTWNSIADADASNLQVAQHRQLAHVSFAPHHYESSYGYPLLVWLHGPGDDERQLRRVMPHISMRNYVAVGPRACDDADFGCAGYQWLQMETSIVEAERRVFDAIDLVSQQYRVDTQRVFLAGYQCGGTMAMRVGLRHPERFAGVLSLSGAFPIDHAPLSQLRRIRKLPLFIAQGRDSTYYPVSRMCEELKLFHAASMHVMLRQYPCEDELTTQMLHDMDTWMMEQINGVPDSSPEDVHAYPGDTN